MTWRDRALRAEAAIENEAIVTRGLRAALTQIHGFASVMDESNWRDLRLHIERQCSARGAFEPAENERRRERLVRGNER